MNRIERLSDARPVIFSLASTLIYIFVIIVISILSGAVPGADVGRYIGGGLGRLIFVAFLLLMLQ